MVHDTLLPWCSYLDWEPEPSIVTVANVQHLGTRIEGRLSSPPPHVATLVRALSPTPALGGHPGPEALKLIAEVEGVERDRYGGAVGWLDADGNGTWAVAIRCAQLSDDGTIARLHAGGGIVADSDPLAELAETQAKFQAMLSAIIRPDRSATARLSSSWIAHVGRPVGGDAGHRRPRGRQAVGQLRRRSRPSPRRCRAPRRRRRDRCRAGVPNSCSKRPCGSAVACGRNEKIPPPSLSTTTMRRSASRCAQRRERTGVVEEGDVADEGDRRRPAEGDTEGGRHHAVDAVGAAVGVGDRRRAAEPLEVAYRHRRSDDEARRPRAGARRWRGRCPARTASPRRRAPRRSPARRRRRARSSAATHSDGPGLGGAEPRRRGEARATAPTPEG